MVQFLPINQLNYTFLVVYLIQLFLSAYFLHWLVAIAWNTNAPITSGIFFVCELISFISSSLFFFTGIFRTDDAGKVSPADCLIHDVEKDSFRKINRNIHNDSGSGSGTTSLTTASVSLSLNEDNYQDMIDNALASSAATPSSTTSKAAAAATPELDKDHVAICMCRYNESLDDLILTMKSIMSVNWPANKKTFYILDDGFYYLSHTDKRLQIEKMLSVIPGLHDIPEDFLILFNTYYDLLKDDCATSYMTWEVCSLDMNKNQSKIVLIARQKPDKITHYKAGNINNFLYNYCTNSAAELSSRESNPIIHQYVLLLDHDMLPSPNILHQAIPVFDTDTNSSNNLAFIQFPQRFYDISINDRFYAGNEMFHDGVQLNRSNVGLAAFTGTNAIWKMSALYHIGGMQYGSLTEDAYTGYIAHRHGYNSIYINMDVSVGQSPQTVADAMRQRMRWSQGALEIIKSIMIGKTYPITPCPTILKSAYNTTPKLPKTTIMGHVVMYIIYLDSFIYPFYSIGYILHVITCILYLYNAKAPMSPSNPIQILLTWLPLYILKFIAQVFAFRVNLRIHMHAQKAWAGYALSTILSIINALFGKASSWFNTGNAGTNNTQRFNIKFGNTIILILLLIAMSARVIIFAIDGNCQAWETMGALLYGSMMLYLAQDWGLEPIMEIIYNNNPCAKKELVELNHNGSSTSRISSIIGASMHHNNIANSPTNSNNNNNASSVSIRPSIENRCVFTYAQRKSSRKDLIDEPDDDEDEDETFDDDDDDDDDHNNSKKNNINTQQQQQPIVVVTNEHIFDRIHKISKCPHIYEKHRINLSVIMNVFLVLLITCALYIWSLNSCEVQYVQVENIQKSITTKAIPQPPLSNSMNVTANFEAINGGLSLNGQTFHIKGANWFGFETDRHMVFGLDSTSQDEIFAMLMENGFNSIRLPLAVDAINNPKDYKYPSWAINKELNSQYYDGDYIENIEAFIKRASQWGIFVLLDMHRLHTNTPLDPLPYNNKTTLDDLIHAWETLAIKFCNNSNSNNNYWSIMGADLKNEPYGTSWDEWKYVVEQLTITITNKCPSWLIFIEGIWKYDSPTYPLNPNLLGPWGSMLYPVLEHPINVPNENKIVYSPHVYGPGTIGINNFMFGNSINNTDEIHFITYCKKQKNQSRKECKKWLLSDNKNPYPNNLLPLYDLWFGFLQSDLNKTVIVGEWGGTYINRPLILHDDIDALSLNNQESNNNLNEIQEKETQWNDLFVDYLQSKQMGSFYWCINPESTDTGGLFLDDNYSKTDTAKLNLLRRLPTSSTINILFSDNNSKYNDESSLSKCLAKHNLDVTYSKDSDLRYEHECNVYNMDYDGMKKPNVIVFPYDENEVSHAVKCAHDNDVQVCVRSGGYSYVGDSVCDGVLIDIRNLKEIEQVEKSSSSTNPIFKIGTGNSMGDLALTLESHGSMAPIVEHHGIGSGGWFLDCGKSLLSRSFIGLGCDHVVSARVVTNNGSIIEVTDTNHHKDLLWALRGAGSGNFGVVTSLNIETVPLVPPEENKNSFIYFQLLWPRNKSKYAFMIWQDWAIDHKNDNFTCNFKLGNNNNNAMDGDESYVEFEGVLWGNENELQNILNDADLNTTLGEPTSYELKEFNYIDFVTFTSGLSSSDTLQLYNPQSGKHGVRRRSFHNKSHMISKRLDSKGIDTFLNLANEDIPGLASDSSNNNYVVLSPLGGRINLSSSLLKSLPSVYPHRSALAVAQFVGYWNKPELKLPIVSHQRRFWRTMQDFWGNLAFYSYKDNELNHWEEAYWGEGGDNDKESSESLSSLQKLNNIKCKYDELNLFSTMRQSLKCTNYSGSFANKDRG